MADSTAKIVRQTPMKPDYAGGGLVNLMASIVAGRGGAPRHPILASLSTEDISAARNVVLLHHRRPRRRLPAAPRRGRRAGAAQARRDDLRLSVDHRFGDHHLLHRLHAARARPHRLVHLLRRRRLRLGRAAVPQPRGSAALDRSGSDRRARSSLQAFVRGISGALDRRHAQGRSSTRTTTCATARRASGIAYETLDELVAQVEAAVKSGAERKFVYAYWPQYDTISHRFGSESAAAARELEQIDAAFGTLLARLSGTDTLVIATADHGFIDSAPEESLELPSSLASQLRFPLCGERRGRLLPRALVKRISWREQSSGSASAPTCGRAASSPTKAGSARARRTRASPSASATSRSSCAGKYTIKDWTPGEPRYLHIGNHGGTSADEMMIPLITEAA